MDGQGQASPGPGITGRDFRGRHRDFDERRYVPDVVLHDVVNDVDLVSANAGLAMQPGIGGHHREQKRPNGEQAGNNTQQNTK